MITTILVFFMLFFVGGVYYAIWSNSQTDNRFQQLGAKVSFGVGEHIAGLANAHSRIWTTCGVTQRDFIFLSAGRELGRIPRSAVTGIFVEDESTISKRITATRLLAVGIFALAAPKKTKEEKWCLLIEWSDGGLRQNTIFEFSGAFSQSSANTAAQKLIANRIA